MNSFLFSKKTASRASQDAVFFLDQIDKITE